MQKYKYLGFIFNKNGNYRDHIKELERKGRLAANKVWRLEESICRDDLGKQKMLFSYLVQSVMVYGVEIWGWKVREELERIWINYVRLVFRLEFCTPKYIMMRELCIKKLNLRLGSRAIKTKLEKKIMMDKKMLIGKEIARIYVGKIGRISLYI